MGQDPLSDLRSWVLGSGQDGHSIGGDPLFFNPAGDDFHLQSTEGRYLDGDWYEDSESSPALNAGAVSFTSATLAASVEPRASSLLLSTAAGFADGPAWAGLEGDFVSYTGISGNTLNGTAGVAFAHATGSLVVQPAGADFFREPDPNGYRVNIGDYGNTAEASKSSRRSLVTDSPLGHPLAGEKWSGTHDISWRAFGDGWTGADLSPSLTRPTRSTGPLSPRGSPMMPPLTPGTPNPTPNPARDEPGSSIPPDRPPGRPRPEAGSS